MMYLIEAEYFSDHPSWQGKIVEARVEDEPFITIKDLDFYQAFAVLGNATGVTMTAISHKVLEVLIPLG